LLVVVIFIKASKFTTKMEGIIANFRQGRHHTYSNQMVVLVESLKNKEDAGKLVGKKVVWNTGKKDISGEVRSAHGNSGALRVLFETGMPGQAVGGKVQIE
jgi:large subunit ribosomal protein L35Ae